VSEQPEQPLTGGAQTRGLPRRSGCAPPSCSAPPPPSPCAMVSTWSATATSAPTTASSVGRPRQRWSTGTATCARDAGPGRRLLARRMVLRRPDRGGGAVEEQARLTAATSRPH